MWYRAYVSVTWSFKMYCQKHRGNILMSHPVLNRLVLERSLDFASWKGLVLLGTRKIHLSFMTPEFCGRQVRFVFTCCVSLHKMAISVAGSAAKPDQVWAVDLSHIRTIGANWSRKCAPINIRLKNEISLVFFITLDFFVYLFIIFSWDH